MIIESNKKINKSLKEKFNRTTDLIYYDVTNFYFEMEKAYEYTYNEGYIIKGDRQYGVSKEERKLPIVQMGMFMDEQGIPISIEIYKGNTLDYLKMIDALKHTVDNFDLSRFIFVGDRGMCSYKNICHLLDHNNGYVICKSIEKSTNEEKAWILDQNDYINESSAFKYKSKIVKKHIKDENNEPREIVEKVVVYWSKSYADRQKAQQKKFLAFLVIIQSGATNFRITSSQYKSLKPFLKNEVENIKTGETLKANELKALIDEEKIKEFVGHTGYYQIISSETNKTPKEIIDIYHGLSRIEDQFIIMKGDLAARPLYVRTHEHIYAHLLICMISLIIMRIIQNKVGDYKNSKQKIDSTKYWTMGLTGDRIQRALNDWTVDSYPGNYYSFNNIDNGDLKTILDAFNIKIKTKLYKKCELKHLKKEIDLSL